VFRTLESEYGLLFSYADEHAALRRVEDLLDTGLDRAEWDRRRDRFVRDAADVTAQVLGIIEAQANQQRLQTRLAQQ
jgi:hypothetical protein